jgi:hypothetical protein
MSSAHFISLRDLISIDKNIYSDPIKLGPSYSISIL